MEGLLAAFTLVMSIFNGYAGVSDDSGALPADFNSTVVASPAQQPLAEQLEKCDTVSDSNLRNFCYAEATKDSFFCDRISDEALKKECSRKVSPN